MDMYCVKCGEPWENDSLHELVSEGRFDNYTAALHDFQTNGCGTFGTSHGEADREVNGLPASQAMSALFDLLGDDVDGAMAMMEDFGY